MLPKNQVPSFKTTAPTTSFNRNFHSDGSKTDPNPYLVNSIFLITEYDIDLVNKNLMYEKNRSSKYFTPKMKNVKVFLKIATIVTFFFLLAIVFGIVGLVF
jgi:hypothetical protein